MARGDVTAATDEPAGTRSPIVRPVRVLMLSWEYPPSTAGGMAAHVDGLAHAMQRAGHDVVLITRRVPGTERDAVLAGVRVLRADVDLPWIPDDPSPRRPRPTTPS